MLSKYSNQTNGINEEKIQEAANEIKNGTQAKSTVKSDTTAKLF